MSCRAITELACRRLLTQLSGAELALVGAAAGEASSATARRERQRVGHLQAAAEAVSESGGERVATAVGVAGLAGKLGRRPFARAAVALLVGASVTAVSEHDQLGVLLGSSCLFALDRVLGAQHERIQGHAVPERVQSARTTHEHARGPRGAHRARVAGSEVHRIHLCQPVPRDLAVLKCRLQTLSESGDRALARVVYERCRGTRGLLSRRGPYLDTQL